MTREELVEAGAQAIADTGEVVDEMKNAAYAELTAQGYLPTSKTDRMAVVDIVVDAMLADLRAKVEALPSAYIAAGVWENPPADHDLEKWDGNPAVLQADVLALFEREG